MKKKRFEGLDNSESKMLSLYRVGGKRTKQRSKNVHMVAIDSLKAYPLHIVGR